MAIDPLILAPGHTRLSNLPHINVQNARACGDILVLLLGEHLGTTYKAYRDGNSVYVMKNKRLTMWFGFVDKLGKIVLIKGEPGIIKGWRGSVPDVMNPKFNPEKWFEQEILPLPT